jgi:hypothetical protein
MLLGKSERSAEGGKGKASAQHRKTRRTRGKTARSSVQHLSRGDGGSIYTGGARHGGTLRSRRRHPGPDAGAGAPRDSRHDSRHDGRNALPPACGIGPRAARSNRRRGRWRRRRRPCPIGPGARRHPEPDVQPGRVAPFSLGDSKETAACRFSGRNGAAPSPHPRLARRLRPAPHRGCGPARRPCGPGRQQVMPRVGRGGARAGRRLIRWQLDSIVRCDEVKRHRPIRSLAASSVLHPPDRTRPPHPWRATASRPCWTPISTS